MPLVPFNKLQEGPGLFYSVCILTDERFSNIEIYGKTSKKYDSTLKNPGKKAHGGQTVDLQPLVC